MRIPTTDELTHHFMSFGYAMRVVELPNCAPDYVVSGAGGQFENRTYASRAEAWNELMEYAATHFSHKQICEKIMRRYKSTDLKERNEIVNELIARKLRRSAPLISALWKQAGSGLPDNLPEDWIERLPELAYDKLTPTLCLLTERIVREVGYVGH